MPFLSLSHPPTFSLVLFMLVFTLRSSPIGWRTRQDWSWSMFASACSVISLKIQEWSCPTGLNTGWDSFASAQNSTVQPFSLWSSPTVWSEGARSSSTDSEASGGLCGGCWLPYPPWGKLPPGLLPATTQFWLGSLQGGSNMQHLENCMFSLTVHCDHQSYLVSSDRPFVVVLGKQLRGEYWDFYPEKGIWHYSEKGCQEKTALGHCRDKRLRIIQIAQSKTNANQ